MASNEAEFKRILNTVRLVLTTQPGVTDSIVNALRVVIVSHV